MRKSNAEKRFSARSELEREVGSVGLLGIILGKGRTSDYSITNKVFVFFAKEF